MNTCFVRSQAALLLLSAALVGCGSSTKMMMIKSDPDGALVTVNGQEVGQTPIQHEIEFKDKEKQELLVTKPDYRPYTRKIEQDGVKEEDVSINLIRIARLDIQSSPDASVAVNGVEMGSTPMKYEVDFEKSDTVEIKLSASGYRDHQVLVEKSGPADVSIDAELLPSIHTETVFFDTDPQGATLTMDNEHLCDTPCEIELDDMDAERKYQVRIERRGFSPKVMNMQYKGEDWKARNFPKKMKVLLTPAAGNEAYDAKALGIQTKQPAANGPMIIAPMMGSGMGSSQPAQQQQVAPQPYYQQQPAYQQPRQPMYQQQQPVYQQPTQQPIYQQPTQQPQQPVYQQPAQQPQQPVYQQPQPTAPVAPQAQPAVTAPASVPHAQTPQSVQTAAPSASVPAPAPTAVPADVMPAASQPALSPAAE